MADPDSIVSVASEFAVIGCIERVVGNDISGWAYDISRSGEPVSVEIRAGGEVVGSGDANLDRADLRRAGYADGRHGFCFSMQLPFFSGQQVELELFDQLSGEPIAATPFTVYCRDPRAVKGEELDSRSVLGQIPPRRSKRQRQMDAIVSPLLKPIRRLRKHYSKRYMADVPAGVTAKLARVGNMSLTSLENVGNWPEITLPEFRAVKNSRSGVSIVVPAFNQFQLTYQCLTSIILSGDKANIEVIVVDDASSDATGVIESRVHNLKVVRNDTNLGFLHSCNKAVTQANGEYIVFLNNDTEVEPGWIDNMLEVFANFSDVGAVGAKLIYPDGRLQDAGGIVWESGQPWNVGHGKHKDDPEYNYVREVDYLTGAALMVSHVAWLAAGGFSEDYAPAYYEDTDLSFKLREAGFRTMYCPHSAVVHYEGCSNGTDLSVGVKQHQVINAEHFKNTWKHRFAKQGTEGVDLRRQKDRNRGLRVLMVDNSFPRLGQDAGSYAAIQELKLLLALNCKVTFLPNNLLHLGVHVDYLQKLGVECVYAPFHRSVAKFMERRASEFDVVYVTRYVVAEKVIPLARQFGKAKIVFNNADLHFLREMRTAFSSGQDDLSTVHETRRRELAVMQSADAVFSYSDIELEIISSHLLGCEKLFRCPWVLRSETNGKALEQRKGLAFLGGYAHPPNKMAVDWFVQNVMPVLHARRPELELHIWGSHVPENSGWDHQGGVVVEGYAKSLDDVFADLRVFIAPLQAGAGIKGKVLDSLAYGVPTVLSPVAAEATGLVDGSSTLIAHSTEQWVEHIETMLDDDELWLRIQANSIALRDQRYSFDQGIEAMRGVFDYLGMDTRVSDQQVVYR